MKIHHSYQKMEAMRDYQKIINHCKEVGREDLIEAFPLKEGYGTKRIDNQSAKIIIALKEAGLPF
jgi:hypothetical protein